MTIPRPTSRASAAATGTLLTVAVVLVCSGPFWAIAVFPLLTESALTIAWLLAATGLGWPIVQMLHPRATTQRLLLVITATALGLGIMSLTILGLGLLGVFNHATASALIAVGVVAVIPPLWQRRNVIESWLSQPAGWGWLWLLAALPAGISMTAALLPAGILWGDEPNGYDVVEYHMQIPREWYEAGKIRPMTYNVFSYFPQGVEMHYLLAMEIHDGPWDGMFLAQYMHIAMCALAVAAVSGAAGNWAGLMVALTPWITLLAPIAYVEGGVLMYGALAIVWAMRAKSWREMILAGAAAGFAAGVKLTCVPMLIAAIPIAVIVSHPRGAIKKSLAFVGAALLVLSPWLLRTGVWTGNPIFPQAMDLLGRAHFSAVQVERWRIAYLPTTYRLSALFVQIIGDARFGFVLIPAGLISAAVDWRRPHTRFLIAMFLLILGVWLGFTHLQSRFFVLAIPICALLIAETEGRVWATGLIMALVICGSIHIGRRLVHYQKIGAATLLGDENLSNFPQLDVGRLRQDVHIDLVGDVSPFWYQVPMSRLSYRTVFDVDTSNSNRSIVQDWLGGDDNMKLNRAIIVDREELERFSKTYFDIPRLTANQLARLYARSDVLITPSR